MKPRMLIVTVSLMDSAALMMFPSPSIEPESATEKEKDTCPAALRAGRNLRP